MKQCKGSRVCTAQPIHRALLSRPTACTLAAASTPWQAFWEKSCKAPRVMSAILAGEIYSREYSRVHISCKACCPGFDVLSIILLFRHHSSFSYSCDFCVPESINRDIGPISSVKGKPCGMTVAQNRHLASSVEMAEPCSRRT